MSYVEKLTVPSRRDIARLIFEELATLLSLAREAQLPATLVEALRAARDAAERATLADSPNDLH